MARGDPSADVERRHPAVLEHPITGRRMLFLNPTYVTQLDGMSEEESRPILSAIQAHSIRPEFTCRFRWSEGTIAIWDNLATQHYAVNDYHGHEAVDVPDDFFRSKAGRTRRPRLTPSGSCTTTGQVQQIRESSDGRCGQTCPPERDRARAIVFRRRGRRRLPPGARAPSTST